MSHSSTSDRGQTEPLAALVAVAVIAIALGVYAAYVTDALPGGSERAVEEPTMNQVWDEIETDGAFEEGTDLDSAVPARVLPGGFSVYVSVSEIDEDGTELLDEAVFFNGQEDPGQDPPDGFEPPEGARVAERSIPVRKAPGEVTAGKLRVVVWE